MTRKIFLSILLLLPVLLFGQSPKFYTSFDVPQWDTNPSTNEELWEYETDRGEPRLVSDTRTGNGNSVHLGDYNGHITRNEIHKNRLSDWSEHWVGFSMKVVKATQSSRVYAQWRNMRPQGSPDYGGINPVTLRQGSTGQMYWATSTIEANVDVVQQSGASTGTESTNFNYNLNEWIDIVLHWEFDPVDGFIQIWVNGDLIVNETGTTTYRYANVSGIPYDGDIKHTIGVYWSKNNAPQGDVYFDEYKVYGANGSYELVHPTGASPNGSGSSCSDGIQNGTETGVDCGGSCPNSCNTLTGITFATSGNVTW